MKYVYSIGLLSTVMGLALGGCVPAASIDARNLVGRPIPDGPMAMLPPVLSAQVQDRTLAAAFITQLTALLQEKGLDVAGDDLGGRVTVRVAATQPSTGGPEPQWLGLSPAQRAKLVEGRPFATVCQPVVVQYGYYPAYVPPQIVTGYDDYYISAPSVPEEPRMRVVRIAAPDSPPRFIPLGGLAPANEASDGLARVRPVRRWGYGYGYGGYSMYVPEHYAPVAEIVIGFHLYDAKTGERIYYIRAGNSSFDDSPGELEKGFEDRVPKAFLKAMHGRR